MFCNSPLVRLTEKGMPRMTEAGDFTEKYEVYREIIGRYARIPEVNFSSSIVKRAYGTLKAEEKVGLFEALGDISEPVESVCTQSMERLGQYYGYILYVSPIQNERTLERIRLHKANDRANIFLGGERLLNLYDGELAEEHRISASAEETGDTFVSLEGWGKGCVFVNGFNIGRFWEIGPQKRLYIPGPLLRQGKNEVIVFETEGKSTGEISFFEEPDIG